MRSDYNPNSHEFHLIILTVEGGYNSGRYYVHRLPPATAKEWSSDVHLTKILNPSTIIPVPSIIQPQRTQRSKS